MKQYIALLLIFFALKSAEAFCQDPDIERGMKEINTDVLWAQLGFLSSDWMEGREAYEKGAFLASDYIASMLMLYGIAPLGDAQNPTGMTSDKARSYFQNFTLIKTQPGDIQLLRIGTRTDNNTLWTDLTSNVDFVIRPGDQGIETEVPVVFAGYGFTDDSTGYNDLAKLNLKGRIILKIAGLPKFVKGYDNRERSYEIRNRLENKYKEAGAIGVLEFDPEAAVAGKPSLKEFMNMSPSEGNAWQGKPYARYSIPGKNFPDAFLHYQVSARVAGELLKGSGINLAEYIKKTDRNERTIIPELKGKSLYIKTTVTTSQVAVRNILGIMEGQNPDKYIVVGAHYDHIGMGNGYIWNGADDNGSGTVCVMTIAKAVASVGKKPENSIIFALWTAEEEGLLGSRHWVRNMDFPSENILLNINFDMISRYIADDDRKRVTMTYTDSYPWFRDITADNLKNYGIDLTVDYKPSDNPPGGTDHRAFVEAKIPVIRIKPGHREEYHTPKDEISTVNWDIMEKIVRIGFADTWNLANRKW
jgi:hypothetical protein